jgi:Protein of unknown function (DUF3631)
VDIENFLLLLEGVKRSGAGWSAKCPAHDDSSPSLSVNEGNNGGIVLQCHAGCSPEAVVAALGRTLADLMPTREHKPRRRELASYPYRDEGGSLLFQVVRFEPKEFRQRRPNGKGGSIWNLNGVKRVLYRLPELVGADPSTPVFIVEGEKDADRLANLGFIATTNPGGAKKWLSEYAESLRGRHVVIVPDNDGPGVEHGTDVARSLRGVAASLRVVHLPNLPNKGDVSDWLCAGGTAEELKRLVQEASEWAPPPVESGAALLDEIVALVRRFIVVSMDAVIFVALWIAHAHAFAAAEATVYLAITSPEKRCGKTTLLRLLFYLVREPLKTSNISVSALFRTIEERCPTLLLDEVDTLFGPKAPGNEELRGLLNSGNDPDDVFIRNVGEGTKYRPVAFRVFCPKAFAAIRHLPGTVVDRSVCIQLHRKTASERADRFRLKTVKAAAEPLRLRLEAWAAANIEKLRASEPSIPPELNDRMADGCEPLLAIADVAGGDWPEKARRALVALTGGESDEFESLGVRLLRDAATVFKKRDAECLPGSVFRECLLGLEESPWSDWKGARDGRVSPQTLGNLLRPFGIKTRSVWYEGATHRGYRRTDFERAWASYLPPPPAPSDEVESVRALEGATGAGFPPNSNSTVETERLGEIVNNDRRPNTLTDGAAEPAQERLDLTEGYL